MFADVGWVDGWVRKSPKMCWSNIGMTPYNDRINQELLQLFLSYAKRLGDKKNLRTSNHKVSRIKTKWLVVTKFFNTHYTLDLKCSFTWSYLSKYSGLCKALNCSFVATGQFFKSQDLRDLFLSFVFFVLSSFMGVRAHIGHNGRESFLNSQSS